MKPSLDLGLKCSALVKELLYHLLTVVKPVIPHKMALVNLLQRSPQDFLLLNGDINEEPDLVVTVLSGRDADLAHILAACRTVELEELVAVVLAQTLALEIWLGRGRRTRLADAVARDHEVRHGDEGVEVVAFPRMDVTGAVHTEIDGTIGADDGDVPGLTHVTLVLLAAQVGLKLWLLIPLHRHNGGRPAASDQAGRSLSRVLDDVKHGKVLWQVLYEAIRNHSDH